MDNQTIVNAEIIKKEKRKYFASFLWKLTLAIVIILALQLRLIVPQSFFIGFMDVFCKKVHNSFTYGYQNLADSGIIKTVSEILKYIYLMAADGIGALVLYLLTKKTASKPEKGNLNFGWWLITFLICFGIGGIGTVIGSIVNAVVLSPAVIIKYAFSLLTGGNIAQSLLYADDSWAYLFFGIITVGIVIPIFEELIFRKLVIDSTAKYGYGAAIMISGFTFAVYHGNFNQFFYAFGLGLLFAYIYANTGKLRYSVFLHMGYNLYAALVIPLARKTVPSGVLESIREALDRLSEAIQANPDAMSLAFNRYSMEVERILTAKPFAMVGLIILASVNLFYFFLNIVGFILLLVFLKKGLNVRKTMMLGQKGTKRCAAGNWGAAIFYVLAVSMFLLYYGALYLVTIFSGLI